MRYYFIVCITPLFLNPMIVDSVFAEHWYSTAERSCMSDERARLHGSIWDKNFNLEECLEDARVIDPFSYEVLYQSQFMIPIVCVLTE